MIAPTNPKKRMLMPSSPLRRTLRGAGHHLRPIVQIGKEGVTEAVLAQLEEALLHHELVKVKVGTEAPEDRFEAAERCGAELEAGIAQVLGRTMLVYRRHPEKPRYEPLTAAEREAASPFGEAAAEEGERESGRKGRAGRRGSASAKPARKGAARGAGKGAPRSGARGDAKGGARRGPGASRAPRGR